MKNLAYIAYLDEAGLIVTINPHRRSVVLFFVAWCSPKLGLQKRPPEGKWHLPRTIKLMDQSLCPEE